MIGIGISTRNRPDILAVALAHHKLFEPKNARFVVIDDSDPEWQKDTFDVCRGVGLNDLLYLKAPLRVGVTGSKNAALWELQDCEHVFLFDDDAWPNCKFWAEQWIADSDVCDVGHSMFNVIDPVLRDADPGLSAIMAITDHLSVVGIPHFAVVENCLGPALYFSRPCLDAIGGYDPNAPHVWGYEHAAMSRRAQLAGFTRGRKYLVPVHADDYVYSVDAHRGKLRPALDLPFEDRSSTSDAEKQKGADNAILMQTPRIYIPLEKPTWRT